MREFIKLIEKIGFINNKLISTPHSTTFCYKHWGLKIVKYTFGTKYYIYNYPKTGANLDNEIDISDTSILEKYFKSELREIKLKDIGI